MVRSTEADSKTAEAKRKPTVGAAGFLARGRSPLGRSDTANLAGLSWKINDPALRTGCFHMDSAMTDYRIDCINKPDRNSPHEHITHVGGPNPQGGGRWKDAVPNVVRLIEAKTDRFYTSDGNKVAWVGVRTSASGRKYLQTHADGSWNNNLLAQSECS